MSETYSLIDAAVKIIHDRRSIRNYTDEPVSDEDLELSQVPLLRVKAGIRTGGDSGDYSECWGWC